MLNKHARPIGFAPRCRDSEVLTALQESVRSRGRMPTTKELCEDIKITRGQLVRNIDRLVNRGLIKRNPLGTMRLQIADETETAQ